MVNEKQGRALRGICIDKGSTLTLHPKKTYFLFAHGPNNFYVSKFNNLKAHFGSYERRLFEILDEPEEHQEDQPNDLFTEQDRGWLVEIVWMSLGYSKEYCQEMPIGELTQYYFDLLEDV